MTMEAKVKLSDGRWYYYDEEKATGPLNDEFWVCCHEWEGEKRETYVVLGSPPMSKQGMEDYAVVSKGQRCYEWEVRLGYDYSLYDGGFCDTHREARAAAEACLENLSEQGSETEDDDKLRAEV